MDDEKIPIEQVVADMLDPNGGLKSWAARDYFYIHYATEEQRKRIDHEDKIESIFAIIFLAIFLVIVISGVYIGIFC